MNHAKNLGGKRSCGAIEIVETFYTVGNQSTQYETKGMFSGASTIDESSALESGRDTK